MEQIEQYIDEIDDNRKQFALELNKLPMNEGNQDNIMLQDIITKNEIATDNSIKLIETSLTETGAEASTQTGGLTLRELEGLDRELRTISGSLRSAIAKSIAKPPRIMCVQYRGGCSVPWGVFSTVGGYHEYRGGYLEYRGGCSVLWGIS